MELTDTHCHLSHSSFSQDINQVIQRAKDHDIQYIIIPGTDLKSSIRSIEICQRHTGIYAAIGYHPNDGEQWSDRSLYELQNLSKNNQVVAIGEIGLDYYRDHNPKDRQIALLECQLELAAKMGLPVILHCREAFHDLWPIVSQWRKKLLDEGSTLASQPGVFHAFEGDLKRAQKVIDQQFLIGLGGPVTYPNAHEKQALAVEVPLESILLETDSPFLSPTPHRGKRNEPANIWIIAGKIAFLKNVEISHLARLTTANANRLFRWSFV